MTSTKAKPKLKKPAPKPKAKKKPAKKRRPPTAAARRRADKELIAALAEQIALLSAKLDHVIMALQAAPHERDVDEFDEEGAVPNGHIREAPLD